ncbi:hypothetical protein [Pseudomonas monachiensis]|uniref:Uncharacterized protein n=1 Tax=Pseudomonas monachiensis TaxID=3060212 RepID=A0ABW9H6A6_9PSED
MSTSLDYFSRGITRAFAKRQAEQTKQLAEQQEIQSVQEKLKQQLLTMANLKAQIAIFQNYDNSITTTKSTKATNTDKLSADEERYRTSLITNMIQLIHSKRKPV